MLDWLSDKLAPFIGTSVFFFKKKKKRKLRSQPAPHNNCRKLYFVLVYSCFLFHFISEIITSLSWYVNLFYYFDLLTYMFGLCYSSIFVYWKSVPPFLAIWRNSLHLCLLFNKFKISFTYFYQCAHIHFFFVKKKIMISFLVIFFK